MAGLGSIQVSFGPVKTVTRYVNGKRCFAFPHQGEKEMARRRKQRGL